MSLHVRKWLTITWRPAGQIWSLTLNNARQKCDLFSSTVSVCQRETERGGVGVCVWCVVSSAAGSVFVLGSSILKSLTLLLREPTTHWHRPCVCVCSCSFSSETLKTFLFLITDTWRHLSSRLRDGPGGWSWRSSRSDVWRLSFCDC